MVTQDNDQDLPPPPYNLTLMKGIKSYKLPRKFVAFVLNHPVAQAFLFWYKPKCCSGKYAKKDKIDRLAGFDLCC